MDKVAARTLRPWEGKRLHQMRRQLSNAVNCRHARIVLLSRGHVGNREIAQRVDCSPQWVRQILHRFNGGGIDAITWYPYYCRRAGPSKFLADIVEQIAEVALSPAQKLIGMSIWSLPKLRDYPVPRRSFRPFRSNACVRSSASARFAGGTPKPGRNRPPRPSGQNAAAFAGSTTAAGHRAVGESASTRSVR